MSVWVEEGRSRNTHNKPPAMTAHTPILVDLEHCILITNGIGYKARRKSVTAEKAADSQFNAIKSMDGCTYLLGSSRN